MTLLSVAVLFVSGQIALTNIIIDGDMNDCQKAAIGAAQAAVEAYPSGKVYTQCEEIMELPIVH